MSTLTPTDSTQMSTSAAEFETKLNDDLTEAFSRSTVNVSTDELYTVVASSTQPGRISTEASTILTRIMSEVTTNGLNSGSSHLSVTSQPILSTSNMDYTSKTMSSNQFSSTASVDPDSKIGPFTPIQLHFTIVGVLFIMVVILSIIYLFIHFRGKKSLTGVVWKKEDKRSDGAPKPKAMGLIGRLAASSKTKPAV